MTPLRAALAGLVFAASAAVVQADQSKPAGDPATPATLEQILMLMVADQGRSVGYQSMLARINLETVRAQIDRDSALLARNLELFERNAISELDLEVSQLKDAWNRLQLVVAEDSLASVAAQVSALMLIGDHLGGAPVDIAELHAVFMRGWEAGCNKGPAEARANEAWMSYAQKALERARELNARGSVPLQTVLERETELRIARASYEFRAERLALCREVFFPGLDDVTRAAE